MQRGADLDPGAVADARVIGLTAGASAPEALVQEVLARLAERFRLTVREVTVAEERIAFRLPAVLAAD